MSQNQLIYIKAVHLYSKNQQYSVGLQGGCPLGIRNDMIHLYMCLAPAPCLMPHDDITCCQEAQGIPASHSHIWMYRIAMPGSRGYVFGTYHRAHLFRGPLPIPEDWSYLESSKPLGEHAGAGRDAVFSKWWGDVTSHENWDMEGH